MAKKIIYETMKPTLKVCFLDWYDIMLPGSSTNNIFIYLLSKYYDIVIDNETPDVLFYGLNYNKHLSYKNCIKIFVTAEPGHWHPNDLYLYNNDRNFISVNDADYIMLGYNLDTDNNKYYYFPNYLMWMYHHIFVTKTIESFDSLTKVKNFTKDDIKNRKFCSFLYLNNNPIKRKEIFQKLTKYKVVDSNLFNKNIHIKGYYEENGSLTKINFNKNYKFSFAFSNHFYKEHATYKNPGFIDEKLLESFISNTVPLYYGNDKICDYYNKGSFLNWHDFENDDDFINKIIELDNDDELYLEYLNKPMLKDVKDLKLDEISEFLKKIINK